MRRGGEGGEERSEEREGEERRKHKKRRHKRREGKGEEKRKIAKMRKRERVRRERRGREREQERDDRAKRRIWRREEGIHTGGEREWWGELAAMSLPSDTGGDWEDESLCHGDHLLERQGSQRREDSSSSVYHSVGVRGAEGEIEKSE